VGERQKKRGKKIAEEERKMKRIERNREQKEER
jgi:hypothetical protein